MSCLIKRRLIDWLIDWLTFVSGILILIVAFLYIVKSFANSRCVGGKKYIRRTKPEDRTKKSGPDPENPAASPWRRLMSATRTSRQTPFVIRWRHTARWRHIRSLLRRRNVEYFQWKIWPENWLLRDSSVKLKCERSASWREKRSSFVNDCDRPII